MPSANAVEAFGEIAELPFGCLKHRVRSDLGAQLALQIFDKRQNGLLLTGAHVVCHGVTFRVLMHFLITKDIVAAFVQLRRSLFLRKKSCAPSWAKCGLPSNDT